MLMGPYLVSTFTGKLRLPPSWPAEAPSNVSVPTGGTSLDPVEIRAMMQNTYSNIGGMESLWLPHTVRRANDSGAAAPRWYQINVTGSSVVSNLVQAATWDPDSNNTVHRFLPSLAVDRVGNMAIGYSAASSSMHPAIKYAGRLASDPLNTFSQTERTMHSGGGSQSGPSRWGDYTHMTVIRTAVVLVHKPVLRETGSTYRTRVGNFKFSESAGLARDR